MEVTTRMVDKAIEGVMPHESMTPYRVKGLPDTWLMVCVCGQKFTEHREMNRHVYRAALEAALKEDQ